MQVTLQLVTLGVDAFVMLPQLRDFALQCTPLIFETGIFICDDLVCSDELLLKFSEGPLVGFGTCCRGM